MFSSLSSTLTSSNEDPDCFGVAIVRPFELLVLLLFIFEDEFIFIGFVSGRF